MQQDLIEWLKKNENEDKNSNGGTGLLLAPLDSVQQKQEEEPEIISEPLPEIPEKIIEEPQAPEEPEKISQSEIEIPTNFEQEEPKEFETPFEFSEPEEIIKEFEINNDTWPETAAKYNLSLDEPPIELWTQINSDSNYDEINYQETESLQGEAYIPRHEHGKNFTQRLQETLRGRRQRAEILREEEAAGKKNNSRFFNAIIMCSAMLIEVALACIALFFLSRYSAIKKFEEVKNLPLENKQDETKEQEKQIEIILPNIEIKEGDVTSKEPEIIIKSPETYESLLREGTRAYNHKDYDKAIINFHKAKAMRDYDIRSYIGLADAYKAKKMYFDSKRIIDEARKKIGRNPTLEVQLKFLERE